MCECVWDIMYYGCDQVRSSCVCECVRVNESGWMDGRKPAPSFHFQTRGAFCGVEGGKMCVSLWINAQKREGMRGDLSWGDGVCIFSKSHPFFRLTSLDLCLCVLNIHLHLIPQFHYHFFLPSPFPSLPLEHVKIFQCLTMLKCFLSPSLSFEGVCIENWMRYLNLKTTTATTTTYQILNGEMGGLESLNVKNMHHSAARGMCECVWFSYIHSHSILIHSFELKSIFLSVPLLPSIKMKGRRVEIIIINVTAACVCITLSNGFPLFHPQSRMDATLHLSSSMQTD